MSNDHFIKSDSAEGRLAEQLKREALADRPAFSAEVHAHVMAAVSAPDTAAASEPLLSKRTARWTVAKWAAIAAGLLIAAAGINQLRRAGIDSPVPLIPPNQSTDLAATNPPRTDLSFDDLNHSAGLALRLVVDRLPIEIPADDWGLPAVE